MEEAPATSRGYRSRKFVLVLLVIGIATGLLYVDRVTDVIWQSIVGTCVLAYLAGNVSQDILLKWVGK